MITPVVVAAAVTMAMAVGLAIYLVLTAQRVRIPVERRRPGVEPPPTMLERAAAAATTMVEKVMRRRSTPTGAATLELAAVKMRPQDFVFLLLVGSLAGFALGLVLGSWLLGIVLAIVPHILARLYLGSRITKRQKAFADQLDDTLQLMASNLRAGHSLPQALASLAKESESPTSDEFTRVVNETRVGRDLNDALDFTAERMNSEDFNWVTQAIAINREVGGNLAEVLDRVADTIRERNDIRRQVASLSAEGRLSAIILMIMPFGVGGFLLMTNPGYLAPLTAGLLGYTLLAIGGILLAVGALWLKKIVEIKF